MKTKYSTLRYKNILPILGLFLIIVVLAFSGCTPNPTPTLQVSPTGINQGGGGLIYEANPLPAWTAGQFGSVQLQASGGQAPYAWRLAPGSQLPQGFTLNANGVLSGTPPLLAGGTTKFITPPFKVIVRDNNGLEKEIELRITIIQPAPVVLVLTVNVNPANAGTVTQSLSPDPAGYHAGDMIMLTANAAPGWTFANWTTNGIAIPTPANTTVRFNMPGNDLVVTANFNPSGFRLTVNIDPPGSGSVARNPNQNIFATDDPVGLTANPEPGWAFDRWVSDDINFPDEESINLNFPMPDHDVNITAKFNQGYSLTIVIDPMGGGSVGVDPATDGFIYKADAEVTLTAKEWEGYKFDRWESTDLVFFNTTDTNPVLAITMPKKDITVIAHFKEKPPETFKGEISTIIGTFSASNGCGWEEWVCGELTITVNSNGEIRADFSGTLESWVNNEPENVICNTGSISTSFSGPLSGTDNSITGLIMDTRDRPLGIDITATRNGDQITATLYLTKVMQVTVNGVVESYPALATTITITLLKQQ